MSKDGVVPPQGGPSRRPAGGPSNQSGADSPQGPAARRYGTQGHEVRKRGAQEHGVQEHGVEGRGAQEHGAQEYSAQEYSAQERGGIFEGLVGRAESGPREAAGAREDSAESGDDADRLAAVVAAPDLDLAAALRSRVAAVGLAGPPPGSLARIRRKARARQRNRAVLAGSAGILMLAVGVTLATGDHFDLVPGLTGAVGLGGGTGAGGQSGSGGSGHPSTAADGGHVVWPPGNTGKNGLAIGPVAPMIGTPSAVAATKIPLCTATSVKTSTTVGPTVGGIVYGHVDAVAQSPCVVLGPPVLTVANQAGTAASSVSILKADLTAASQLPSVPTWGTTLVLSAGEGYEFQFAWAADGCPQTSASPSSSNTPAAGSTTYYLGYAVIGTTPTTAVTLKAACGAQVYVTDLYQTGAFPLPKTPTTPPATSPSAVGTTTSTPSTTPSTAAPPDSSSPSPSSSPLAPNGVVSGNATPSGG